MEGFWNSEDGEVRAHWHCDLSAMRSSRLFKSNLSRNVDYFDSVKHKGVEREAEQLRVVHAHLDRILEISH